VGKCLLLPDVLDVDVDNEAELHRFHQNSLLNVGQGQTKSKAVDLRNKQERK
jgi:hypothetical protein